MIYRVQVGSGGEWKATVANQTRLVELPIGKDEPLTVVAAGRRRHSDELIEATRNGDTPTTIAGRGFHHFGAVSLACRVFSDSVSDHFADQPVADRDCAAAVYAGVRFRRRLGRASRISSLHCRLQLCRARRRLRFMSRRISRACKLRRWPRDPVAHSAIRSPTPSRVRRRVCRRSSSCW